MNKKLILGFFIIVLLFSVTTSSAGLADLEGKSRTYTYKKQTEYTTYDGGISDSFDNEMTVEIEFLDEVTENVLSAIVTSSSDSYSTGYYSFGTFQIAEASYSSSLTEVKSVEFPSENDIDLFIEMIPYVVADTSTFISNLIDEVENYDGLLESDSTENSVSYTIENENPGIFILPASLSGETIIETIKFDTSYDDDGLLQSYEYSRIVIYDEITLIDISINIRRSMSKNSFSSPPTSELAICDCTTEMVSTGL